VIGKDVVVARRLVRRTREAELLPRADHARFDAAERDGADAANFVDVGQHHAQRLARQLL